MFIPQEGWTFVAAGKLYEIKSSELVLFPRIQQVWNSCLLLFFALYTSSQTSVSFLKVFGLSFYDLLQWHNIIRPC